VPVLVPAWEAGDQDVSGAVDAHLVGAPHRAQRAGVEAARGSGE